MYIPFSKPSPRLPALKQIPCWCSLFSPFSSNFLFFPLTPVISLSYSLIPLSLHIKGHISKCALHNSTHRKCLQNVSFLLLCSKISFSSLYLLCQAPILSSSFISTPKCIEKPNLDPDIYFFNSHWQLSSFHSDFHPSFTVQVVFTRATQYMTHSFVRYFCIIVTISQHHLQTPDSQDRLSFPPLPSLRPFIDWSYFFYCLILLNGRGSCLQGSIVIFLNIYIKKFIYKTYSFICKRIYFYILFHSHSTALSELSHSLIIQGRQLPIILFSLIYSTSNSIPAFI